MDGQTKTEKGRGTKKERKRQRHANIHGETRRHRDRQADRRRGRQTPKTGDSNIYVRGIDTHLSTGKK